METYEQHQHDLEDLESRIENIEMLEKKIKKFQIRKEWKRILEEEIEDRQWEIDKGSKKVSMELLQEALNWTFDKY